MNSSYFNSNKSGIPTVKVTAVNTADPVTTLVLPERTFWGKWYQGIILLEIDQDLTATTATNTISISVNGETRPLTLAGGEDATVGNVAGSGAVFQIFYDKPRNLLQLMSMVQTANTGKNT